MKKIISPVLGILLLSSCAKEKNIDGKTYRPYGLLNEGSCKNDSVYYEISGWACLSGVLFSECLFIPTVYTFGYNLWEPKCSMKQHRENKNAGVVN